MSSGLKIAIVGASGGIGAALLELLSQHEDVSEIHATYFQSPAGSALGSIANFGQSTRISWRALDASIEDQVQQWLSEIDQLDWLINCVGMLHNSVGGPEKTIRQLDSQHFAQSMSVNCLPTMLLAKHAQATFKFTKQGVFATVSARVGSIDDNRLGGWYSYRASKAALNMVLKCLAIEWQRSNPNMRVLALHPGTTDSRLSKPFQKNVPNGKLFSAEKTASLLLAQIQNAHRYSTGRFIAYDGEEIPW